MADGRLTGDDAAHLRRALDLAERGRRTVAPNPPVGCVLVRGGRVVAEGWHERPGREHAEAMALAAARDARGATAYVTLEPCSHHGRTPPCADALVAARVARVVVAAVDPGPHVAGGGIERLRAAGIAVDVLPEDDPLARRARRATAGYRTWAVHGRPHVTYKAAMTVDGRTATRDGDSRWISGPESRALVHAWRAAAGAVLVGVGTAIADDPLLTARDVTPPAARQPLRVVADRSARLPVRGLLAQSSVEWPVLALVAPDAPVERRRALESAGVETAAVPDLGAGLRLLAGRHVTDLLCEGGATLAGGLVADGLVDRVAVFVAPRLLGDPFAPGLLGPAGSAPGTIAEGVRAVDLTCVPVGGDTLLDAWLREPP